MKKRNKLIIDGESYNVINRIIYNSVLCIDGKWKTKRVEKYKEVNLDEKGLDELSLFRF